MTLLVTFRRPGRRTRQWTCAFNYPSYTENAFAAMREAWDSNAEIVSVEGRR